MTAWILVALISNGHFKYSAVPTIEFRNEEHCKAALTAFTNASLTKAEGGTFMGYCVKVEK